MSIIWIRNGYLFIRIINISFVEWSTPSENSLNTDNMFKVLLLSDIQLRDVAEKKVLLRLLWVDSSFENKQQRDTNTLTGKVVDSLENWHITE